MIHSRDLPVAFARSGVAGTLFVGTLALLASVPGRLLGDPDTLWHVAIGRAIVENRAVPWTDTFSYTFTGAPWIAKEWLAQVMFAGAYEIAGWAAVALLAALAFALTLALLQDFLETRLPCASALAITLTAGLLCAPHLLARPHLLALPLIVIWARGLIEAVEARDAPPRRLALVMLAWANVHAGFTIGFVLAGLSALDAVWRSDPARRRGCVMRWSVFLLLCLAAACTTPYGHRAMLVTVTLFGSGEPLPYITEWQPLERDLLGCLGMGAMALTLGLLLARPRENLFRIALVALLAFMTLRHGRFLELLALVAPVVVVDPVLRLAGQTRIERVNAPRMAMPVAMLAAALVAGVLLHQHPRPDAHNAPEAALHAAEVRGLTAGRVYNAYDFGGFLISKGIKTFIDGRSDQIFLGGFTQAVHSAADARDPGPFLALLDGYEVCWALVRVGSGEARHLNGSPQWAAIFADADAQVFMRAPR